MCRLVDARGLLLGVTSRLKSSRKLPFEGPAMKRISIMLTMLTLMVAMMALSALPASAEVLNAELGETCISAFDIVNVKLGGLKIGVLCRIALPG